MAVEFGASIKLDSTSATEQMRKFAAQTTEASKSLRKFQNDTKATAQGGGQNVFRAHINSSQKANQQILKSIALIHDQGKAYSKLSDIQKSHVATADKLNRKYDESARVERQLVNIRKELRIVTASGLKTQKEADIIFNREAETLRRSTKAYKDNIAAKRKAYDAGKKNITLLHEARMAHDKEYAINRKVAAAKRQLLLMLKAEKIDRAQYNRLLDESRLKIKAVVNENHKLISTQQTMVKMARLVSVYSRLLLGTYAAIRVAKMWVDFEKTAEAVELLKQKLQFLTGESGAYQKLYAMTQDVGIRLESANKIMTRFAVVTNRAFSTETMAEWSGTLIKSARATGTSTQEMTGALIQITQAMSAGRLMGDEYRSVTENLPLLTVALRDIFGQSTSSLKELSSQGLITNEVLIEAFGRTKVLLEGFPDSTQTIEAALGRLSSSWDNLVSKMSNTDFTKSVANELAEFFNNIGDQFFSGDSIQETEAEIQQLTNRLEKYSKYVDSLKKGNDNWAASGAAKQADKQFAMLNSRLEKTKYKLLELQGLTPGQLAKKRADEELQRDREANEVIKQKAITLKLIEKIQGGKALSRLKEEYELERQLIEQKQKRYELGKAGGLDDKQAADLVARSLHNEKVARDKIIQTQIDAELRLKGFTTRNNIDKIEEEFNTSSRISEIRKKAAKDRLTVASEYQARIVGLQREQAGDQLSTVTREKMVELNRKINEKELQDIKNHINAVTVSINSITSAAQANAASLGGDLATALGFEKLDIISQYEAKLSKVEKKYREVGDARLYEMETGNNLDADRLRWIETLKAERDARLAETEDKMFGGGIEDVQESLLTEEERLRESYLNRQLIVEDAFQNQYISEEYRKELLLGLETQYEDAKTDVLAKAAQDRIKITSQSLGAIAGIFDGLGALMSKNGKEQTKATRALARASIIASTAQAVMNALAVPPYPLGVALAAGAALKGAAQLQAVGGGGGTSTGTFTATTNASPAPVAAPAPTAQPTQTGGVTNINMVGRDRTFTSEDIDILFDELGEALDRGDRILFTSDSRQALELG